MNSTFKVVFNKARGALMVVNEVTSSVQAKGTKTVVATAVAAMFAGVAGTATAAGDPAVFGTDGVLTLTTKVDAADFDVTATNVKVSTAADALAFKTANFGADTVVKFNADGKSVLNVTATAKGGVDKTVAGIEKSGAINFTAFNDATTAKNATLTVGTGDVTLGVAGQDLAISFANSGAGTAKGTSTLKSADGKALTLGTVAGDRTAAGVVALDVKEGAKAVISAGTAALSLNNVTFANAGELTLTGATVALASAYDGKNNAGKVIVNGNATITEAFNDGVVYVGTTIPDTLKTVETQFNGDVAVSGTKGAFAADTLYVADKNLTLSSKNAAEVGAATLNGTGQVYVGAEAVLNADALSLEGSTGGLSVAAKGSVSGTSIVTKKTGNVITNSGKIAYETLAVTATTDNAADLTVTSDKGTITVGNVALTGVAVGKTATFTLNTGSTRPDAIQNVAQFNVVADELTLSDYSKVDVKAGAMHVLGDVTVGAKAEIATTAGAELVVDKTLTLGNAMTNGGTLKVGTLNNAKTLTNNGTLAITGVEGQTSENSGTITGTGNVTVKGDFTNKKVAGETEGAVANNFAATGLTVEAGSFVNEGYVSLTNLTLDKGAVYTSAMNGADKTTTEVSGLIKVNKGATFKIDGLNDKKAGTEATAANNLLALDEDWTLNGGTIELVGADIAAADVALSKTLTVQGKSEQAFGSLDVTTGGKLLLNKGNVTVGTLNRTAGTVTITDGSLTVKDKLFTADTTLFTIGAEGELNVSASALGLAQDGVGAYKFEKTTIGTTDYKFNGLASTANSGLVNVEGVTLTLNTANANALAGALGTSTTGLVYLSGLTISDALVVDGKIGYDKVKDLNGILTDAYNAATVTGVNAALRGGFANVELVSGGSTTAVTVDNALILNGTGNLVTYKDAEEKIQLGGANVTGKLITTGENATIGKITATGNVNVKGGLTVQHAEADVVAVAAETGTVDVDGNLTVNGDATIGTLNVAGVVTMGTVKTAAGVEDDADLTIKTKLEVAEGGELVANGKVTLETDANQVNGIAKIAELEAAGKKISVGDATHAGTIIVKKLTKGTIFGDPDFAEGETTMDIAAGSKIAVGTAEAAPKVVAGRAALAALGVDSEEGLNAAVELIKANGFTEYVKNEATSIVYVDGTNGAWASQVIAGNYTSTPSLGGVKISDTSLVFVDQATVEDGAALFVRDAKIDGELYVANANATKTFKITEGALTGDFDEDDIMVSADRILGAELDDGEVSVYVKEGDELGLLADAVTIDTITDYYAQGLNNGSAWFEGMMTRVEGGPSDKDVVTALNDVAAVGATAGMAAVTMDALSAFNDTVAARTSILAPNAEGVTVWADVNGGKYEAKKLMNGAGYSSDIYAGVIGVDTTVACGAKIGAAITVGTGDTDSKNTSAVTSMDSDFFGVSIYTAKQFGAANVAVDLGYMQGSNDVTLKTVVPGKFSADSDAFTIGVRGELLAKVGDFNLVPHAGLRWTRLSVDDFQAGYTADLDTLNVFQLPVGVTVSGEFEAAGFTWAPAFDLSFVPAFGDKEQAMTLGIAGANVKTTDLAVQVIDSNPVQATLGIDATKGAWVFGLNYKLGVGTDSRMNNSFNANVRYTF